MNKVSSFLSQTAYMIYAVLFAFVFYVSIFNNASFRYDLHTLLGLMGAIIGIITVAVLIYSRFSSFLLRHRYKILILACAGLFAVQYTIGRNVVHSAIYDHERVLNGAMLWAQGITGEEFAPYSNYVHYYTNNIGLFMVQQQLFKAAAALGFTNFYDVAIFTGHILFTVMIITSFLYLDENISGHRALFFLLIISMYPPLYFQSSVSYTDTYSVWGIPCLLLFISRGIKATKYSKKIFYAILSVVVLGLASQIKATVAIVAIALFIQMILHDFKAGNLAFFCVLLSGVLLFNTGFEKWTYNTVRDKNRDNEAMPVTHWFMMGLQGDGSYSGTDEHRITLSVAPEKRVEKNLQVIDERLSEMGVDGYLQLLYRKTCRTFGSGNAEVYYTFKYDKDNATPFNFVYECTLEDGKYYPDFNNISQAVYMCSILFGVIGSVIIIFRRKGLSDFSPYIALIGFWMFMMLWESNHRQLINQWSLFYIVAAIGIYHIMQPILEKSDKHSTPDTTTDSDNILV